MIKGLSTYTRRITHLWRIDPQLPLVEPAPRKAKADQAAAPHPKTHHARLSLAPLFYTPAELAVATMANICSPPGLCTSWNPASLPFRSHLHESLSEALTLPTTGLSGFPGALGFPHHSPYSPSCNGLTSLLISLKLG